MSIDLETIGYFLFMEEQEKNESSMNDDSFIEDNKENESNV